MLERLAKLFSFATRRSNLPEEIDIKFVPVTNMDTAFTTLGVPKDKNDTNFADAAANLLWVYVAVNKIVNTASMLPLKMYSISKNSRGNVDKREISSGLQWELFNKPSLWMTPVEFKQSLFGNFALSGNSYTYIDLKEKQLWPLKSQDIAIVADGTKFIRSYVYRPQGEKPEYLDPAMMLHVKSFNPISYFYGLSPLQAAWSQVQYLDNDERFWNTFWKEGGRLYGIFTSDGPLTDGSVERLKTALKQSYGGVKKMQANIVLDNGMKFQQIGVSQKDAQLLEKAQATKEEILAAFGIPQALANIMDDANYSNMEVQERLFYQGAIQPMLSLFEEALSSHPVLSADGLIKYEFDLSRIDCLKQSDVQKAELGAKLVDSGQWTQNEAREKLWGMEPLADGNVLKPLNNQIANPFDLSKAIDVTPRLILEDPLQKELEAVESEIQILEATENAMPKVNEPRKPKKPRYTQEFRDSERKAYDDQLQSEDVALAKELAKVFRKAKEVVLANIKKKLKNTGPKIRKDSSDDFLDGLDGMKDDLISALAEAQSRTIKRFGERSRQQIENALPEDSSYVPRFNFTDPRIGKYISQRSIRFGGDISERVQQEIRDTIAFHLTDAGDDVSTIADAVSTYFDGMEAYQAMRIARTETAAGAQEAIEVTYQTNADIVKGREWVTSNDDRVRDSHQIDGQVVALDENFILGSGVEIEYPVAPAGPAEEVINCRCTTVPVLDFEEV